MPHILWTKSEAISFSRLYWDDRTAVTAISDFYSLCRLYETNDDDFIAGGL